MAEESEDERHDEGGDAARPVGESALSAAVDDALADEVKRQRARFVQEILGVDRAEGVGRGEAHWSETLYRDHRRELGLETPDDEAP
ncbi:MAG: hypothetical protein QOE59_37 [Actinomycetota bacterium]|jgi:hypothetical protein|nr:hypothetical protein [Actinomycetota bacterium]